MLTSRSEAASSSTKGHVELPESAEQLVALVEQEAKKNNFRPLREALFTYERKKEQYENETLELEKLRFENASLRQTSAEQAAKAEKYHRHLHELLFRFASQLGGAYEMQDDEKGRRLSHDEQRTLMMNRLLKGIDLMEEEDEDDGDLVGKTDAEAVDYLKEQRKKLREVVEKLTTKLSDQCTETVNWRESMNRQAEENRKTIEVLALTRDNLDKERTTRIAQVEKGQKEITNLKQRMQQVEARTRSDLANMQAKFQKKEIMLTKTNQNLTQELARLKDIERRMEETLAMYDACEREKEDILAAKAEAEKEAQLRYTALKFNVMKILVNCSKSFDKLPLAAKIRMPDRSTAMLDNYPSLIQLNEIELGKDLLGLHAAIQSMAKILAPKFTDDLLEIIEESRKRIKELMEARDAMNRLMLRLHPTDLPESKEKESLVHMIKLEVEAAAEHDATRKSTATIQETASDRLGDSQYLGDTQTHLGLGDTHQLGESSSSYYSQQSYSPAVTPGRESPATASLGRPGTQDSVVRSKLQSAQSAARSHVSFISETTSGGTIAPQPREMAKRAPEEPAKPRIPKDFHEGGVFANTLEMMDDLRRAGNPEWKEYEIDATQQRMNNLMKLGTDLEKAQHAQAKLIKKKLPPLDQYDMDPNSPFGQPRHRAGGRTTGKLFTLAVRRGVPASKRNSGPGVKLVVKNGNRPPTSELQELPK